MLSASRCLRRATPGGASWAALRQFSDGATVRSTAASGSTVYESGRAVEEYLHFHYAPREHMLPYKFGPTEALDFPARMAAIAAAHSRSDRRSVAYDVGCAVGRGTFEMTKTFDKVVGVDFSHAFIAAAQRLQELGSVEFEATEQALVRTPLVAHLPEGANAARAEFRQGDACNLGDIGAVDCITAVNLLCRLPEPQAFLQKSIDCIRPGGILVLVSPFSWLEEYTPQVSAILGPFFELEARTDEAFLLREHARKFQWGVSDACVWRRK
mmetsp:Transcript_99499/g.319290  ORF Transcript_99499/g.319290 Transcript_99499/m.319290 type:complete len:269 (-) Transcript_99499:71-877(-)